MELTATNDTAEVASILAEVGDARIEALEAELLEARDTIHDQNNKLHILSFAVSAAHEALKAVQNGNEWTTAIEYALDFIGKMKKEEPQCTQDS